MAENSQALPINTRMPLIVVRREFFDQFAAGTKTIEYRRHRPPFTMRAFYQGRRVRIAYNYDVKRFPTLLARVAAFTIARAGEHLWMTRIYPDLKPDDELALIQLDVERNS